MQKTMMIWRLLFRSAALVAGLMTPALAFAQSCALCYSQAAGSGTRLIQALRSGILILVFPPMLICIGLAVMAYRKRNQFNEE
jgi:ABC-type Fe3+ transport system permease subunit